MLELTWILDMSNDAHVYSEVRECMQILCRAVASCLREHVCKDVDESEVTGPCAGSGGSGHMSLGSGGHMGSGSGCFDMPGFMDVKGYDCAGWVNEDCFADWDGYTPEDMEAVRSACPYTCGMCGSGHDNGSGLVGTSYR